MTDVSIILESLSGVLDSSSGLIKNPSEKKDVLIQLRLVRDCLDEIIVTNGNPSQERISDISGQGIIHALQKFKKEIDDTTRN